VAVTDLSPRRKRLLAELAVAVFAESGGRIQVNPRDIISELEIGYSYDDYGDCFDGLIEHRLGEFHIYCNSRTNEYEESARTRFTLAHELGHYFIDEHRNLLAAGKNPHGSSTDGQTKFLVEREANYFASNLLMPKSELLKLIGTSRLNLQALLDSGSHFGVSAQSSAIRCVQDSLCRSAVIMFRPTKMPWSEFSIPLQASGFTHLRRFNGLPPPGGASAKAWETTTPGLSPIFSNTSTACTWFSGHSESGVTNEIIAEESVRLGSRGVLTLLTFQALTNAKICLS
jgi:IrrE N-terminal-like domain